MQKGANILHLGEAIDAAMAEIMQSTPAGFTYERIANQPKIVEEAVGEFMRSFAEALAIVLAVSFLSLGWRTGIVVALSVPLVLGIVFVIMQLTGINLHRITLGALIIALGLMVDDAIIAVEMMLVKMEQGVARAEAAAFAWTSTAFPRLTGALVTTAGFMPVGLAVSSTGEYAGAIFSVVGNRAAVVLGRGRDVHALSRQSSCCRTSRSITATRTRSITRRCIARLRAAVEWCVQHRGRVVAATVARVRARGRSASPSSRSSSSRPRSGPSCSFSSACPKAARSLRRRRRAKQAEQLLAGDEDAATWTTYIGQGPPRFWLGLNPALPNEAYAEMVIVAKDIKARERLKTKFDTAVANGALPEARVRTDRFTFGPPVGFPVQFRVIGTDPLTVRSLAYQVRDIMRADPDTVEPQLDWDGQMPSVRLVLDQDRARALGLDPQTVSQSLQALVTGYPVTTVRDRTEKVVVVARAIESQRNDLGSIGDLTILARNGVPGAAGAGRPYRAGPRGRDPLAPQPRPHDDGARRHSRRRPGPPTCRTGSGPNSSTCADAAGRLSVRDGRLDRGVRQSQHGADRDVPGDDRGDAVHPDVPAAELLPPGAHAADRTARPDRRDRGLLCLRHAVRVRDPARPDRARRHDHPQHRHPDRSDRPGPRCRLDAAAPRSSKPRCAAPGRSCSPRSPRSSP